MPVCAIVRANFVYVRSKHEAFLTLHLTMSYYYTLGTIPPKRHTQFRQPDGSLYKEEVVSSKGFSGIYSILYHTHPPTKVRQVHEPIPFGYELAQRLPTETNPPKNLGIIRHGGDYLEARKTLLANSDVSMAICSPTERTMPYFYKNGEADEVLFVHEGSGVLFSQFGKLRFEQGDYVVIPRTTIYKLQFDETPVRLLIIESVGPIETVKRYRNELGQLLEHSPYCERDIRPPVRTRSGGAPGQHWIKIKKGAICTNMNTNLVHWM